jgi:hypothetical protein
LMLPVNFITVGTGEAASPEAGTWPHMIGAVQSDNANHKELRSMIFSSDLRVDCCN